MCDATMQRSQMNVSPGEATVRATVGYAGISENSVEWEVASVLLAKYCR